MATLFLVYDTAIRPQVHVVFCPQLQRLLGTEFMMRLVTQIVPCRMIHEESLSEIYRVNAAKIAYF